jgi:hypothetical protein
MKTPLENLRRAGNQQGNALIGAVLVLLVLTAVGTTYVAMTKTETQIAGHEKRHVQSMFNAEAGIGEALARMSSDDPTYYFGEDLGANTPTPGWGRYVVMSNNNSSMDPQVGNTASDNLDNDDDGLVDESGEKYPEVLTSQSGGDAIQYPWVKVRYRLNAMNQVVLFGDHDNSPTTDPCPNMIRGVPILVVSAEGAQGTADRRIEVEAIKVPFLAPKAAIYCETDQFAFNGTAFLISGKDWDPATGDSIPGAPEMPGIETTMNPSTIAAELRNNQVNNVEGQGTEPAIRSAPYDYDLEAMLELYKDMADITHSGGTIGMSNAPYWGNLDDYHIVSVTDDLHISGSVTGGGLLLLEGDFSVSGSFTWYGMIINLGRINYTGGGNEVHIYGTVMTTGGINTNVFSGNADFLYSSLAIAKLAKFNPYRVSAWTELP